MGRGSREHLTVVQDGFDKLVQCVEWSAGRHGNNGDVQLRRPNGLGRPFGQVPAAKSSMAPEPSERPTAKKARHADKRCERLYPA